MGKYVLIYKLAKYNMVNDNWAPPYCDEYRRRAQTLHGKRDQGNIKWNEWGHLCAQIGYTGPWVPTVDGEMSGITLPSENSDLRSNTLPLGH